MGLTTLNDQLFVGYDQSTEIEVFDIRNDKFEKLSSIYIPGLRKLTDLTSCSKYQCLYLADWNNTGIHKLLLGNSEEIARWPLKNKPQSLSVNLSHNVLVTFFLSAQVKEFTTQGRCIRRIQFQTSICYPWHTVQLSDNRYVVCHGWKNEEDQNVSVVDETGAVIRQYAYKDQEGEKTRHHRPSLNRPVRLALMNEHVFLVDHNNSRVLLLNQTFTLVRKILSGLSFRPWRLCINERNDRLFLYTWNSHKINVYLCYRNNQMNS